MSALSGLDRWLTTDPYADAPDILMPGDEGYPRCGSCGAWLKREPDSTEYQELTETCTGRLLFPEAEFAACGVRKEHDQHEITTHAWDEQHRTCARCGRDNVQVMA